MRPFASTSDLKKVISMATIAVLLSACSDVEFLGTPLNQNNTASMGHNSGGQNSGAHSSGYGYSAAPTTSGPLGDYKVGKPYTVNGRYFKPAEDYSYSQTGNASWYGEDFRGKSTSNGEIFNPDALTAAHPTLPMPSMVLVTNLENGRQVKVRINDRGPFVAGRIIDVSLKAAQILGFAHKGLAHVRVDMLAEESRRLKAEALGGKSGYSHAAHRWAPAPESKTVSSQAAYQPAQPASSAVPSGSSQQPRTVYQPASVRASTPYGSGVTAPQGTSYAPASAPLPLSRPVPPRAQQLGAAPQTQQMPPQQVAYTPTAAQTPSSLPVPTGAGPAHPAPNGVQALPSNEEGYQPTEMWPLWPPLPGEEPAGPITIADFGGGRKSAPQPTHTPPQLAAASPVGQSYGHAGQSGVDPYGYEPPQTATAPIAPVEVASLPPQTVSSPSAQAVYGTSQDHLGSNSVYGDQQSPLELPPVSDSQAENGYAPYDQQDISSSSSHYDDGASAYHAPFATAYKVPDGVGDLFVQAGAFADAGNAQRLQHKLSTTQQAEISPATVNGMQFYRVRLGPFTQTSEAQSVLGKVIESGHHSARLIRD